MASPESLDRDVKGTDTSVALDPDDLEMRPVAGKHGRRLRIPLLPTVRAEIRWFHHEMHGDVPAEGEASPREIVAASRIAGWLTELEPQHRGAFVVRYRRRRWPARLTRQFGGLTSVVVRLAAIGGERGPNETLAQAEEAAVAALLESIAAAGRPYDVHGPPASVAYSARDLRRLLRAARSYVWQAEIAYSEARGDVPCVVPASSREGA
jgi:hypothetical protein